MDKALEELKKYAFVTLEKDGTYTITKRVVIKDSDYDPIVKAFKDARSAWVQAQFALTIAEAASPWIRMSVPMATDGGGMYFQPEKGDEVMVDYENGNIDRPFVTGTLYSKNVPAPSRGKRVIVSKNGHTIKMDDPDDSTLILQGIFPLAKALASYGVKFPQLVGDPSSALGGIELTDKPGIYSIKMSSHDRQIKISSPLGDVKVDAFTGITLDAPNGDITINGKNVYISAYNKMTLTSGKNIMQGGMGGFFSCVASGKSWGFTAAKTLLNLTAVKFFDMSLIRTVIEVFIRPIDGTMKLKSYRYMMMEAGPGGAADDKAAYASRPMDKRTAKKANNARLVSDFIGVVDGKLDRFISEYVRAFNELRAASENFPSTEERNYFGIGKNIERPANKNDFLKDMFEKAPADGTAVFRTLAGYIGDENQFKFRRPALPSYLEHKMLRDMVTLMEKVIPLKKLASDFEHILDDLGAGGKYDCFRMSAQAPGILTTEPAVSGGGGGAPAAPELFSDSIRLINDFVQHPDESIFDDELHEADFAEWKKYIKRRIAHAVIEQCRGNNNPIEGCNFPAAEYGTVRTIGADLTVHTNYTTLQDGANPFSDADWANYVNAIKIREKESNDFVEGFKASAELIIMNKIMPFEWWVWKPDSQGKILFSDNKGKTVRFKNGETESYDNPDRLFDEEETHLRAALQF